MLIKSLKLKKFRQFKGDININFSYDPQKNVTIILGDNTYGKTTLLQAFNWCFYKTVNFDHNPKFLLNYELSEEMLNGSTNIVSVEIVIIHENTEYGIIRKQEYKKINGKTVLANEIPLKVWYKNEKGNQLSLDDSPETWINDILPKDLSTYFFFDTERVNSISHKENVTDAVKGLLGLTALSKTIEHLGSRNRKDTVIGKFQQSLETDNVQDSEKIRDRIQNKELEKENVIRQIKEAEKNKSYYEVEKERLDRIINANLNTKKLQEEEKLLETKIKDIERNIEQKTKMIYKNFYEITREYFEKPLVERALSCVNSIDLKDDRISGLSENILRHILERGICVCGNVIKPKSSEYYSILKEIENVSGDNLYDDIKNFKYELKSIKNNKSNIKYFQYMYKERLELKKEIENVNSRLIEIRAEIKDKENMYKYEVQRDKSRMKIKDLEEKIKDLYQSKGECVKEIEKLEKNYQSLISKTDNNRKIERYIEYADALLNWIKATQEEKTKEIKQRLEEKVNDIFNRIYSGKRSIYIDDKYQANLITKILDKEYDTGKSEGLDRVKNFAFIGGLVSLAKEKIISSAGKDCIDLSSEPYPLVMDAPFSNADEIHTAKISEVLPDVAEQVIMFVMRKDYIYAEPYLKNKIGKKYKLEKHSEVYSELMEIE